MIPLLLLFFGFAAADPGTRPPTPDEALVPGIIDSINDTMKDVLSAPSTVRVGEDFKVTITTFGGGCEREGDTTVIMSAIGANVIVYDITAATNPKVVCTAVIKRLPHTVTLRFEKPGQALIRVWGRKIGGGTDPFGAPAVLEHRVTIK